jgi:hypothetical protein
MDDHARRVLLPFVEAWQDFQQGRATLLDLSRLAEQAASSLDNASDFPRLLGSLREDLESAYFTNEQEQHQDIGRRLVAPLLAALDG